MNLRLHAFLPLSRANGPGRRAVIWVQGCTLRCPGCYNPETHSSQAGEMKSVDQILKSIVGLGSSIEGITLSGGEPLEQRSAITELLRRVKRQTDLSAILFTGWSWKEIHRPDLDGNSGTEFLGYLDVLIAGRFDQTQRLARGLRGSANKTVHFLTARYTIEDLENVPPAEVMLSPTGDLVVSGIDHLVLQ